MTPAIGVRVEFHRSIADPALFTHLQQVGAQPRPNDEIRL
jgi:hypothetical protein